MATVTIHDAKNNLLNLVKNAAAGEEIIITARGKPIARLVAFETPKRKRDPGSLKGKLHVGPEFFEPLPNDELADWG